MPTYLLDANAFSALMARRPQVSARASSLGPGDRLVICTIVRGEIGYGLERMPHGHRRRELEARAASLFDWIPCESIGETAGDIYARIKHDSERRGGSLDENDLWIAATALSLDAVVVTSDSDFQRVRGLRTEDWIA